MDRTIQLLVVEDDPVQRMLIEKMLEKTSDWLNSRSEASLAGAQAALYSEEFDIVISDYILPDGKGTELIDPERYPLIVMTSQGSQQIAAEIMKAGAHDYLVKSQELFNEFPHVVQRTIREWSLQKENEKIQQTLSSAETLCAAIFNQFAEPLIICDADVKISMINLVAHKELNLKGCTGKLLSAVLDISDSLQKKITRNEKAEEELVIGSSSYAVSAHPVATERDPESLSYLFHFRKIAAAGA